MSTLHGAARVAGRLGMVLLAGGSAAVASVWGASARAPAPADLPELAEEAPSRSNQIAALKGSSLATPFDILIIGGGATGSGVALDAATRGLRVALVERNDFGSGTSSKSTKLVHGGVRYLEKAVLQFDSAQLKLVYHALKERATLLQNAPHLTWPLPTLMPCYDWRELPYSWAGLKLYDLIAGPNMIHPSRFVTPGEAHSLIPTLLLKTPDGSTLKGGLVYTDGQMDDARLNVALALTAARAGAVVANHVEVTALTKDPATGLVTGAKVQDKISGAKMDIHAKTTVNATGVYSDRIRKMASPDVEEVICASSGVHIVLPEYFLGSLGHAGTGLIVPRTKDGRVLFALPWLGGVMAGTTDEQVPVTDVPKPTAKEVAFIVETLKDYLNVDIAEQDVLSTWSGLRPLVKADGGKEDGGTQNLVRDHVVIVDEQTGLVTITGGKWTTYRSMAEETVDTALAVAKKYGHQLNPLFKKSVTEHIPITGAEGYHKAFFSQLAQSCVIVAKGLDGRARPTKLDPATAKHLAHSYGFRALHVLNIAKEGTLGTRLSPKFPYLEAEVVYAARHEMCSTATDFLLHRSRLAFLDAQAALDALPRVVEILAKEHRWSGWQRRQELAAARSLISTFREAR